ncbi:calcium-dependent protein kinase 29-like [Forsythia ovata]|uniref:Calcium-dependent protein kinase 29-like n=1 Tax=Forsythia ovata TaxID=205694 RepID=A0ABD1X7C7_9LAMI
MSSHTTTISPPPWSSMSSETSLPSKPLPKIANSLAPPSSSNMCPILGKPYIDITILYYLDKELGKGNLESLVFELKKQKAVNMHANPFRRKVMTEKDRLDVKRDIIFLSSKVSMKTRLSAFDYGIVLWS